MQTLECHLTPGEIARCCGCDAMDVERENDAGSNDACVLNSHIPEGLDDITQLYVYSSPCQTRTLRVSGSDSGGERRLLCIEQTVSGTPQSSLSASSSHACCYGGLPVRKTYPQLLRGSIHFRPNMDG